MYVFHIFVNKNPWKIVTREFNIGKFRLIINFTWDLYFLKLAIGLSMNIYFIVARIFSFTSFYAHIKLKPTIQESYYSTISFDQ